MLDIPLPIANVWYGISNAAIVIGAVLGLTGTLGLILTSGVKERFADERVSANEAETAVAKAGAAKADERAALAQAEAAKANEGAALAQAETARANERAALLEKEAAALKLELQQVRLPITERRLSEEQIDLLGRELQGSAINVSVFTDGDDRETNIFAGDLMKALALAGLRPNKFVAGKITMSGVSAVPNGLNVIGTSEPDKKLMIEALRKAGIRFGTQQFDMRNAILTPVMLIVGHKEDLPAR